MNREDTCYIVLIRGINVGGHTVTMVQLRELFTKMGFRNVRSYIQTGNIFFESDQSDTIVLRDTIENRLSAALGWQVFVCIRSIEQFEKVLELDPFQDLTLTAGTRFSIVFLRDTTQEKIPVPYLTADGGYELVGMTNSELFVVWHLKNGRPANSYDVWDKKLLTQCTTRFWHTAHKILLAAQKATAAVEDQS